MRPFALRSGDRKARGCDSFRSCGWPGRSGVEVRKRTIHRRDRAAIQKEAAMSWHLQESREVQVGEGDGPVDTHIDVRQGDTLFFHAWGSIWAGVWWTGNNGPRGW